MDWVKSKLGPLCRQKTVADGKVQWYFTKSIRIPGVTHTVRIVVLWKEQRDTEPRKILITNRTYWEVHRTSRCIASAGQELRPSIGTASSIWAGAPVSSGMARARPFPLYLVFLAYSALMGQLQHDRAQEWAHARLTTIGESCRAMFRETLGKTIAWVIEQVMQ